MAKTPVSIYQKVEIPEYMFVTEAVLWIALGRIAEIERVEFNGQQFDDKVHEDFIREGWFNNLELLSFTQAEFEYFGYEIDYERYIASRLGSDYGEILDEVDIELVDSDGNFLTEALERRRIEADRISSEREEWAVSQQTVFQPVIDRGWALLFEALASRSIQARGWFVPNGVWEALDEDEDFDFEFEILPIGQEHWSLSGFDLNKSILRCGLGEYLGAQVASDEIFERFPSPVNPSKEISGQLICDALIVNEASPPRLSPKITTRGRPPKALGDQRSVVANYFSERLKKSAPDKKEALVQDVIDFVRIAFRQEIKRSTAQNYLKEAERLNGAKK